MNLYAYCYNDPVNYADPSGNAGISLAVIGLIIGAVIGATVGGVAAYNIAKDNGAEGWELFGWTALGTIGGGLLGGALGYGAGALITKATNILGLSFTGYSVIPIKRITVLGNFETYRKLAHRVGGGYYYIPNLWYKILSLFGLAWKDNLTYLQDATSLGTQFVISPTDAVPETGTLWKEIQYLLSNNIPWLMI